MPTIDLKTEIKAKIEICFDLSCSIDLHTLSTSKTNEKAIDGRTSGLIVLDDFITWEATHFVVRQQLTSKITQLSLDELNEILKKALEEEEYEFAAKIRDQIYVKNKKRPI